MAISLNACENNLKNPEFKGSGPTGDFLAGIGELFDSMNSKYTFKKGSKAAMSLENEQEWRERFDKCDKFIRSLKHDTEQLVIEGLRKNCWLGWLANMETLRKVFDAYVRTGMTDSIKVYRLSQDPLESFFGSVRGALGGNNNPTIPQFKGAYQRLGAGALLKSGKGANVMWDEEMKMLKLQAKNYNQIEKDKIIRDLWLDKDLAEELRGLNLEFQSDYIGQVMTYMSGAAQRKVSDKVDCENCVQFLRCGPNIVTCTYIERSDRGGW